MPIDTAIYLMAIMLLLGVVIGMALSGKHVHGIVLFGVAALIILLGIYIFYGGHALHLQ